MVEGISRSKEGIPKWSGEAASFQEYEEQALQLRFQSRKRNVGWPEWLVTCKGILWTSWNVGQLRLVIRDLPPKKERSFGKPNPKKSITTLPLRRLKLYPLNWDPQGTRLLGCVGFWLGKRRMIGGYKAKARAILKGTRIPCMSFEPPPHLSWHAKQDNYFCRLQLGGNGVSKRGMWCEWCFPSRKRVPQ